ncbi:DUF1572 family protein [Salinicoccus albus]|uniref:DUF1572 family protein n=1 Tax=Salinicoccus albus TaxID=418756 RepID=UPI00036AEB76|nr:DUF1572 family protein [Salinicoccus albus]
MDRYFFTTDGEKGERDRDGEFMDTLNTKAKIEVAWEKGWQVLLDTLNDLSEEDLLKTIKIRGKDHTLLEAIKRQIFHYSYHVGQMVFIGKQIKGEKWQSLRVYLKR